MWGSSPPSKSAAPTGPRLCNSHAHSRVFSICWMFQHGKKGNSFKDNVCDYWTRSHVGTWGRLVVPSMMAYLVGDYTLFLLKQTNRLPWVIWGHFTSASLTLQRLCPVKLLHSYALVVLAMWKVRFFLQRLCFPAWTEHGVQKSLKKAFGNSTWNLFFIR